MLAISILLLKGTARTIIKNKNKDIKLCYDRRCLLLVLFQFDGLDGQLLHAREHVRKVELPERVLL